MKFFKSAWFKCIACLLVIAVVSGGLLTILSNLWKVSPEERTARAMAKIYGQPMEVSQVIRDIDSDDTSVNAPLESAFGQLEKIYKVNVNGENYDLVFQAKGNNGYKGGTITLWVKVIYENGVATQIDKVILQTSEKQTLMSKLGGDFYDNFTLTDVTEDLKNGKFFTSNNKDTENVKNLVSGATMSANAAANAVNCVIDYIWGNK